MNGHQNELNKCRLWKKSGKTIYCPPFNWDAEKNFREVVVDKTEDVIANETL